MISIGTNLRSITEQLKKVPVKYLYDTIRNAHPNIEAQIRQLRIIKQLNLVKYNSLKLQLPYFTCAIFNPPFRKTENFAYTEYFTIDIDNIYEKGLILENLQKCISEDSRTLMCFISPGGDGLKVIFKLSDRCYDAAVYKVFYRLFAGKFSSQYSLQQVIDSKTCDVTRACFLSMDPNIYFNPDCETINIKDYIDTDNIAMALNLKHETEKQAKDNQTEKETKKHLDIDKETIDKIKQTLNPNAKLKARTPNIYVPNELEDIMEDLKNFVTERNITITEIRNINYGKKMRFKIGFKQAEINLFFGKHGFTVVQSPRTGTDQEMNKLMAEVVESFIAENI